MFRKLLIAATLIGGLTAGPAQAGQILIGYFDGNDSAAAVRSALLSVGRDVAVSLFDKSDDNTVLTTFDVGDPDGKLSGNFTIIDTNVYVQFMAVKASNRFALYEFSPNQNAGSFSSAGLLNKNGKQHAISHISFYNAKTVPADVPEPAMVGLFGLGLVLLGARRRRLA